MGNLRLYGSTSGYTELAPPAVAPDGVLVLPSGTGTIAKTTDQGLAHINTTTFSAVSSVSLNDVFTSDYQTYEINFRVNDYVTSQQLQYRFRLSGTDNTSGAYTCKGSGGGASTVNVNRDNQTIGQFTNNDGPGFFTFRVDSPALATQTRSVSVGMNDNNARVISMAHLHTGSTAFDGITFIASTGNMSGFVSVYGYKNS